MSISKELQTLKEFQCTNRSVLSVYLNTNPADPDQLKGAWSIQLRSGLKRMEEYIIASKDEDELNAFKTVKEKVLKEIEDRQNELNKGVIIFASENPSLWSVHYVQVHMKTSFHWEDHPVIGEMEYIYKAYPEAGIVLPSFGEVRILDTAMGFLNDELIYDFEPNLQEWGNRKKVTPDNHPGIGSTKANALEPRLKENLGRFYKGIGEIVDKLKKERGWKEIYVAGEAEMAKAFAETLREKPARCIHKNLNNSKSYEVIHQVLEK